MVNHSLAPFIIAVDGVAASGKGTLSERLAKHFCFAFLDTGKLYRIVASNLLENSIDPNNNKSIIDIIRQIDFSKPVEGSLHTPQISDYASKIAVHQDVRNELNTAQRDFPKGNRGAILDGRDIGTVIFPNANLKLFITADTEIRAERRFKQLQIRDKSVSYSDVLKDLRERDERDSQRKAAPTIAADDAIVIDTTKLDVDSVFNLAVSLCQRHVDNYFNSSQAA